MPALTGDILKNRDKASRYKKFLLPVILVVILGAAGFTGYLLYSKSQKNKAARELALSEQNAQNNSTCSLPKDWVIKYFATDNQYDPKVGGGDGDPDEDILSNCQEYFYGTDPTNPDTMGSGQLDGAKVVMGLNPLDGKAMGELAYVEQAANRFSDLYQIPELKKENVKSQVLGLLNPPDPATLDVGLPDPSTLKVISDNSISLIYDYLSKLQKYTDNFDSNELTIQDIMDNPGTPTSQATLANVYEIINVLREMPVPSDLLKFHQLHIAFLYATANIMEINKTIDPNIDFVEQQAKVQDMYHNVAIIEKSDEQYVAEVQAIQEKYGTELNEYAKSLKK